MNKNFICVYDFETGGRNVIRSQPIQLAAAILDPKTLQVVDGGTFESLIKPIPDKDCEKYGLEPIQDEALQVNKKDRKELKKAPEAQIVWELFTNWINNFNVGKNEWGLPVRCGYNIVNFDDYFVRRLCCGNMIGEKEPYKFGPANDYGPSIFHPIYLFDVMLMMVGWFENKYEPNLKSFSMDNLRKFTGMESENAHDALQDVYDTAELLNRLLNMQRHFMEKGITFEGRCKNRVLKPFTDA